MSSAKTESFSICYGSEAIQVIFVDKIENLGTIVNMKTIAIILGFCLFGCSYTEKKCGLDPGDTENQEMCLNRVQGEWLINSDFSLEQIDAIVQAGDEWEKATDRRVQIGWNVSSDAGNIRPIEKLSYYEKSLIGYSNKQILIQSDTDPVVIKYLMKQEFGRQFGIANGFDINGFNELWKDVK